MTGADRSAERPDQRDDRTRRVDEVVAHYLDRLNAGEPIDALDVFEAHPDSAEEVLEELYTFAQLGQKNGDQDAPLGTLGDYTLRRQIGRGGMGVVYEAWQNSMDRRVALKVLPTGLAADEKTFTRFMREAKTAGKLDHPNVVAVYAAGFDENTPYYAMELVEGETLAQILVRIKDAEPDTETPFGKNDDARYFLNLAEAFAEVAEGLQHAHSRGVIHRDIKPSNLILDADTKLRILDFGLARLEGQESLTLSGDLMGTVLYMSPEQAMAKRIPLDHRTDVYSLGATMYEVVTGQTPFKGKDQHETLNQIIVRDARPPRQSNEKVPADLETIVLKCLRKDPGDRYGTAEALAQDLRRLVRGDPVEARRENAIDKTMRFLRRHRLALGAVAAGLVLVAACAGLTYQVWRAEEAARSDWYEHVIVDQCLHILAAEPRVHATDDPVARARSVGEQWVRGVLALEQRRWRDAITAFNALQSRLGEEDSYLGANAEIIVSRAIARLALGPRTGELEKAVRELSGAIALWPDHFVPKFLLARAYVLDNKLGEAARFLFEFYDREISLSQSRVEDIVRAAVELFTEPFASADLIRLARDWVARSQNKGLRNRVDDRRLAQALLYDLWRKDQGLVAGESTKEILAELADLTGKLFTRFPERPDVLVLRGKYLLAQGELANAMELYTRAFASRNPSTGRTPSRSDRPSSTQIFQEDTMRHKERTARNVRSNTVAPGRRKVHAMALLAVGFAGSVSGQDGHWVNVRPVSEVNLIGREWGPTLSHDGREMVFASDRPGGEGDFDLYLAQREDRDAAFTVVRNLVEINTSHHETNPNFQIDDLTILYTKNPDLDPALPTEYVLVRRADRDSPFAIERTFDCDGLDAADLQFLGPTAAGRAIFASDQVFADVNALGNTDLYEAFFDPTTCEFSGLRSLTEINSSWSEHNPSVADGGRALFWAEWTPLPGRPRPSGQDGGADIWFATRPESEQGEMFGPPLPLPEPAVNTDWHEFSPCVTSDWPAAGAQLFFVRDMRQPGFSDFDIFVADWLPRSTRVFLRGDCNEDGTVNVADASRARLALHGRRDAGLPCRSRHQR